MEAILDGGRVRRSRHRRIATALAVIVAQAGYWISNAQPGGNTGSEPSWWSADRCTGGAANHPECNTFSRFPTFGGGTVDPADELDEYIAPPAGAVRDALEAVDDLLWQTPDSSDWSEAQWSEWQAAADELRRACDAIAPE